MRRARKPSQRRELSIVIIEDDPLALRYEWNLLNHFQNYNGFHLRIWGTIKLDDGIEKCTHDFHPADVVILELSLLNKSKRNIINEIKELRPDIIIIGIASHVENYPQSMAKSLQLHCIVSKVKLNRELPDIIESIYRQKTPSRYLPAAHDGEPPTEGCEEIRRQLPGSCEKPYCQGTTKRPGKSLNGSNVSDKTKKTKVHTAHKLNRFSMPRKKKSSQRSEISLRGGNQEKHHRDFSQSKPVSHDLNAARRQMEATSRTHLPSVPLTPTELRIIELSTKGLKPGQIAKRLGVSVNTIYSHRSHIMAKCGSQTWSNTLLICQQANGTE